LLFDHNNYFNNYSYHDQEKKAFIFSHISCQNKTINGILSYK